MWVSNSYIIYSNLSLTEILINLENSLFVTDYLEICMFSYVVIKPYSDPFLLSFKDGPINLRRFPPLSHVILLQD